MRFSFLPAVLMVGLLNACHPKTSQNPTSANQSKGTVHDTAVTVFSDTSVSPIEGSSGKGDTLIIVKGKRDLKSVETEVKRHLISVHFWYHRKPNQPRETKRITIGFRIDGLGVPFSERLISTDLADSAFVKKVVDDVANWRFTHFPNGTDTTDVVYPILFTPASPH